MKVAIASCARIQQEPLQPVWAQIQAAQPDLLLLLGDSVYLERDDHHDPDALAAELRSLYQRQRAEPHFRALCDDLAQRGKALRAIYDDHDFLGNDRCGAAFPLPLRQAARQALWQAFAQPRTGAEAYLSEAHGLLRLLLLDTRFHRQPREAPQTAGDADAVLGAAQWRWLEAELARCDTPYALLASSTSFHAWRSEAWEFYPAAFERLRALLRGRAGALLVSGDIHSNELYDDSGVIEVVSSGAARHGRVFGQRRQNWGLLHFSAEALHIQLHSLKPGDRMQARLRLADWRLG